VNFVSRDLLEARDLDDAMHRVCSPAVSVGHCYNLMDVRARRIVTVETASRNRFAVHEAGPAPSFHANMYRHLEVEQVLVLQRSTNDPISNCFINSIVSCRFSKVYDENSMSRERRAAQCVMDSKENALYVLGDADDEKYPIFMTGNHLVFLFLTSTGNHLVCA
jgi:hypothetical protein